MITAKTIDELAGRLTGPVVFTVGFFDGVHLGHRYLLDQLQATAQRLDAQSLVVTFSNSPRGWHQPGKQFPYLTMPEEKLALLAETGVDATLMLRYDGSIARQDSREFMRWIGAHVPVAGLTIGYDSRLGSDQIAGEAAYRRLADELGIALTFVPEHTLAGRPVKSRQTRELVRAGEMDAVRRLLGHPYFIMGTVGHGKGKATNELHIPTANLALPAEKLAPPVGIYAGLAHLNGAAYPAACCVMTNGLQHNTALERDESPQTVASPQRMIIEAHLVGFSGDLYGRPLRLELLRHLRGWIDFDTSEALHAQISKDIAATLAVTAGEHGAEPNA
ncbi:hypothetical protein JW859_07420 [bacterium]|nr:hypothetical protein [bacterium]